MSPCSDTTILQHVTGGWLCIDILKEIMEKYKILLSEPVLQHSCPHRCGMVQHPVLQQKMHNAACRHVIKNKALIISSSAVFFFVSNCIKINLKNQWAKTYNININIVFVCLLSNATCYSICPKFYSLILLSGSFGHCVVVEGLVKPQMRWDGDYDTDNGVWV